MTFGERLEAAAVAGALHLVRALGPVAASNLGGAVARAIGPRLPVSRVAHANLRAAMPELDEAARRRVVRGVWDNIGRTACELPHLGALGPTASGPGWEFEGEENLQALREHGGPAIFFSGHIANWEVMLVAAAAHGLPAAVLYRAARNAAVDRVITDLRRESIRAEVPMIPKGAAGARQALAHLHAGGRLGLLMDQKMNDGIEARFFGRPAMTAPALAALALRFRCPVFPIYVQRLAPARFRVLCEPPLSLPDTGNRRADIAALTQQVNDRLEAWIRQRPADWLWLHRRWPKEAHAVSP